MSDSDPSVQWDSALIFSVEAIVIRVSVSCFAYGCFLILAILAVRVLIYRRDSSPARRYLLAAALIFILSSTVNIIAHIASQYRTLALGLSADNEAALLPLIIPGAITALTNFVLNETLVVWRAWILADHLILRVALVFSTFIAAACLIVEAVLVTPTVVVAPISLTTNLLLMIPLILNNVLATTVVLYKTWVYRKHIKIDLPRTHRCEIERVLLLLIESGFIYCAWWIIYLVSGYVRSVPFMMYTVTSALAPFTSAIYPMLIILVIEHQKSVALQAGPKSFSFSFRLGSSHGRPNGDTSSSSDPETSTAMQSSGPGQLTTTGNQKSSSGELVDVHAGAV